MTLNAISSSAIQPAVSESRLDRFESTAVNPSSLEYLDLAHRGQQLTEQVFEALQRPSDAEIQAALNTLDDILHAAEMQSAEALTEQPLDAEQLQRTLSRYVLDNTPPDDSNLCRALYDLPSFVTESEANGLDARGGWSRLSKILLLSCDGYLCRYLGNTFNTLMRTGLCVAVPTLARQVIAFEVESGLNACSASREMRFTLAAVAGLMPTLLNVLGAIRDRVQGTETQITQYSRTFNILVSTAALVAAGSTGVLSGLASTLVAFQGYSLLREGLQSALGFTHRTTVRKKSTLIAAGLYVPNQLAVSLTMSALASPSGAAAALNPPLHGALAINNVMRAGLNMVGETADFLTFTGVHAIENNQKLKIKVERTFPSSSEMATAFCNDLAARTALMNTPLLASAALESAFGEYFDAETRVQINDVLCAGILGVVYPSFIATITGHQPAP